MQPGPRPEHAVSCRLNAGETRKEKAVTIHLHEGDIPADLDLGSAVAVDTETMGLKPYRDRLCLVQLSAGDGDAHLVRFAPGDYDAPHLKALLEDPGVLKIFHYGRFDIAMLRRWLGVRTQPVWCTKIASRLTRTYTDRHGLKDLCRQLLGVELSKEQQSSDWGAPVLSEQQLAYAAADVLYLHRLKVELEDLLRREGRLELAEAAFRFLPWRAELDLIAGEDEDIFAH